LLFRIGWQDGLLCLLQIIKIRSFKIDREKIKESVVPFFTIKYHKMERFFKCLVCSGVVGVFSLLIGFGMFLTDDYLFSLIVKTQLALSPTSGSFPMWQDLPAPIKTSMFVVKMK